MSVAIVGWTGFVGQNLINQLPLDTDLYNSKNINNLVGKTYDTLYFSAMPAEKWRINKDPAGDYSTLVTLQGILKTVTVKTFILISTVDVFDCAVSQFESGTKYAEHPYGRHRRELEEFILGNFANAYIIRLPGLFGWGLKKNILYDLLNNNQLGNICPDSEFQWYFLDNLVADISACVAAEKHCVQLVSEPVTVRTIVESFFPEKLAECCGTARASYNLITEHGRGGSQYWSSASDILQQMGEFIKRERKMIGLPYRLSMSNIAWNDADTADIYKVLRSYHITAVELAPTKIYEWADWREPANISKAREKAISMPYTSCQSILYGTGIKIFEQPDEFCRHYEYVCSICNALDIKYIVFGSPSARHRVDGIDHIGLFRQIGEISAKYGVICCIEPNSSKYGCTWLTHLDQVVEFVKSVAHSAVMINFDFGNYYMESDTSDIEKAMPYIAHIQVSLPFLDSFNHGDDIYKQYRSILQHFNTLYGNTISLEMKSPSMNEICKSVKSYAELFIHM